MTRHEQQKALDQLMVVTFPHPCPPQNFWAMAMSLGHETIIALLVKVFYVEMVTYL